jgi:hypothetical protein
MKLRILSASFAAVLALTFSSCGKSEADQKAAIENFKKEAEGLDTWMNEKQKEMASNPLGGLTVMKELIAKMKNIKSDDLPADLKDAWTDFLAKLSKMDALFAELGSDPADVMKRAVSDPQVMQNFATKAKALEAEITPAAQKLAEVGKKYGLEKIGQLGPK